MWNQRDETDELDMGTGVGWWHIHTYLKNVLVSSTYDLLWGPELLLSPFRYVIVLHNTNINFVGSTMKTNLPHGLRTYWSLLAGTARTMLSCR